MLEKVKKNLFWSIAAAALIYLAFSIFANVDKVASAFMNFNWFLFPVLLALAYMNYLIRFLKWDYYLKVLGIKISKLDSFAVFMSGLIMSVTPGKMGELLKAYLVKQISKEPISKSAPIVLAERITDFISLVMLAIIGAYVFSYGRVLVIGTGIFFLLFTLIISNKKLSLTIIGQLKKIRFLSKHPQKISIAYESSYTLLRPVPLISMILLSLVSWFFECFAYYLILNTFDINVSLLLSTFIYTFSTIAGAITMLPGGLGATEGSLMYLLIENNIQSGIAVLSTFIIRVVTLWFAVLVGIISVIFYQKRYGKISIEAAGQKV